MLRFALLALLAASSAFAWPPRHTPGSTTGQRDAGDDHQLDQSVSQQFSPIINMPSDIASSQDGQVPAGFCANVNACRQGENERQRYRLVGNSLDRQIRFESDGQGGCQLRSEPNAFNELGFVGGYLDAFSANDCDNSILADGSQTGFLTNNGFLFGPGDPLDEIVTFTRQGRQVTLEFGPGRQVSNTRFNNVPTWFLMGPEFDSIASFLSFRNTSAERFFGLPGPAVFANYPATFIVTDMVNITAPFGTFPFIAVNQRLVHGTIQVDCGTENFSPYILFNGLGADGEAPPGQRPIWPTKPYGSSTTVPFPLPPGSTVVVTGFQIRLQTKFISWIIPENLPPQQLVPEAFPAGALSQDASARGGAYALSVKGKSIADHAAVETAEDFAALIARA